MLPAPIRENHARHAPQTAPARHQLVSTLLRRFNQLCNMYAAHLSLTVALQLLIFASRSMTRAPIWTRLDLGLRPLRIVASALVAFPAGILVALVRAPLILLPALPDCLKMTIILPVLIPLVTLGSGVYCVYWLVRKIARALVRRLSAFSSEELRLSAKNAGEEPSFLASVDKALAKDVSLIVDAPGAVTKQKATAPRAMRIEIPPASAYPSPPLTTSSRNSSICFESAGPLTPISLSPSEDPMYTGNSARSHVLQHEIKQLDVEDLAQVEMLVSRLLQDSSDKLTPVPRRAASFAFDSGNGHGRAL
ncbi:hypothetical protein EXIGLDRAFT_774015 [Exidia glandulosa HHB12029]|uniref:Uncharacterized protein n=1 Tax=Exidia glandulosa HHB12029 TaxID=1314781 RepID=A0A165EJS1_EXIGL|nr:hypothetical protein EXIGLDRAFT_774015 [Exidia glandulosa HHB12029]